MISRSDSLPGTTSQLPGQYVSPLGLFPHALSKPIVFINQTITYSAYYFYEASLTAAIYAQYPLSMAFPVLGFIGVVLTILLSRTDRPQVVFPSSLVITGIIRTAGISLFLFIMPSSTDPGSSLTAWDAQSSHLTLSIMFWAVVIFPPLVIGYTLWNYRKLWGRLSIEEMQERTSTY